MSNNGMKGKFRERLRLIIVNRYKEIKGIESKNNLDNEVSREDENDKFIRERVNYIRKRLAEEREQGLDDGFTVSRKRVGIGEVSSNVEVRKREIKNLDSSNVKEIHNISKNDDVHKDGVREVKAHYNVDKDLDNSAINCDKNDNHRIRKNLKRKKVGIGNENQRKNFCDRDIDDKEKLKDELKVKIIKKIRSKLDDNINEIEVLESELYFLGIDNDKELELKKVQEIKKKIDNIIKKIDDIKREYDIFKNNYYLEDVTDLDDKLLIDDIIDYKNLLDNIFDNKKLVDDYKLLDEYKDLYDKLEDINGIRERLVSENENKINNYADRDKKYSVICEEVVKIEEIKKDVDSEIERQNRYLDNLMSKIGKIDKNEYSIYKFRGLGELISNSLKYMGLMMVSPFLGFLPGIAASTIATRSMIKNIRKNMGIEEIKKVHYVADDFNSEINHKLNDIDYVYYVIDDALDEIDRLKRDFLVQYNSSIEGYSDTLNKINKIEGKIINNRKKVDIIKRKMFQSKKINEDKMIKVKKLNQEC